MSNIEQIESDYEWSLTAKVGDELPRAERNEFEVNEIDRSLGKGGKLLVNNVVRACRPTRIQRAVSK